MLLDALENPLPELKKIIRQQRLGNGGPKAPIGGKEIKRKGAPLFKHPLNPRVEAVDDEKPKDLFFQQGSNTSQQIKKEPGDLASFADMSIFERSTDLTRSNSVAKRELEPGVPRLVTVKRVVDTLTDAHRSSFSGFFFPMGSWTWWPSYLSTYRRGWLAEARNLSNEGKTRQKTRQKMQNAQQNEEDQGAETRGSS